MLFSPEKLGEIDASGASYDSDGDEEQEGGLEKMVSGYGRL